MKNYYASRPAVDGNCSHESCFDITVLKQPSLSHSVLPPESENNHSIVVLDDDMLIVNDMDSNIIQNGLSPEHQLLQNKKRAANEDDTGIDNSNIADKVAQISMDNGD